MKKVLLFFVLFMGLFATSWAYNFSAVSPSGHTLFYNIISGGVEVTFEFSDYTAYGAPKYTNAPTGTLTIPSSVVYDGNTYSVTSIGTFAFYFCSGLTSVTIPNSVTSIGESAFNGCSGLTSLTIPNSVTSIGYGAFVRCSGLTAITIPSSVDSLGPAVFNGCNSLAIVNYNATNCIYNCTDPTPLSHNRHFLFTGCPSLITLNIGDNVTHIPDSIFGGCSGLTSVTIGNSVTSIGSYAFVGCSGLTSLTIPNSVTSIGSYAFVGCSGLTSLTIPNSVTSIGFDAFSSCSGLISVTIPNSMTSIEYGTFSGCSSLTSVTIGNSVTSIEQEAFSGCSSLMSITFDGRTPPTVGENAFYNVPSNVSVTIPCGTLALYMSRLPSTWNNYTETTLSFAAQSADESMGTVQVLNEPTCTNPNAVLNAVPASGYRFDHWSTGSTQNPYSLTVTTDTVITAYFVSEGGTEGIEDINADGVNIYVKDGRIVVDGTTEDYQIYDITGRMVAHGHGAEVSSPLSCGVYLVKVGIRPAYKVVVR